jgi:hypothetical protein
MQLFSEDFSDELGTGENGSANQPMTDMANDNVPSASKKEYTAEELQETMRCLMTLHPQLWKDYKEELSKEQIPTHPETVRRVLIDFLHRHKCDLETASIPKAEIATHPSTWKPGSVPAARRRPRKKTSMVNSLRDSLHRSLHAEELSPFRKKSQLPPLASPTRRMPPRRGSVPLRQPFSDQPNRRSIEAGSDHSVSSASFHGDEDVVSPQRISQKSTVPPFSTALPMDHEQKKLMRLQQIPHLWMMYQSERLYRQTATEDNVEREGETKGADTPLDKERDESTTPVYIPTVDHSTFQEFWNKHEVEILEYEAEEEQARIAAREEEKRQKAASRVHLELNVSFHEEASARQPPRHYFTISDHEEQKTPLEDNIGSSRHNHSKIHQDSVQQKLARVKQVPTLWGDFQGQLEKEDNPTDVEMIKNVINRFWLEHEAAVISHERRAASLLNTSFHEESVLINPNHRKNKSIADVKQNNLNMESFRQRISNRSLRFIQTSVNDSTEELSPLRETSASNNAANKTPPSRLDRRAKMMEMYQQKGEGFSIRSMRNIRVAIDGLAGEVDGKSDAACEPNEELDDASGVKSKGSVFSFLAPRDNDNDQAVSPKPSETTNQGWLDRLSHVSALLTHDLESEVLESSRSHGSEQDPDVKPPANEEDDDELFVRAAEIATARRHDRAFTENDIIKEEDQESEGEEVEDPMSKFLQDPMLEVTMHNDMDAAEEEEIEQKDVTESMGLANKEKACDDDSLL